MNDLLTVYEYNNKIRLGAQSDGGYVIADLGGYDCYISAGVSNEESFSRDFIKRYKMNKRNSIAFDGTIDNYPYEYTKDITFVKKNISPIKNNTFANLSYFIENYNSIFLKMDIEGAEYEWLNSLNSNKLSKFKQIVMEFHGINDDSWGTTLNDKIKCFEILSESHYIVHAHGNNHGPTQDNIPDVIEITFLRKNCFVGTPKLNKTPLPIQGLDFPCNLLVDEHALNFKPFVN
jgi:hypothetical protein